LSLRQVCIFEISVKFWIFFIPNMYYLFQEEKITRKWCFLYFFDLEMQNPYYKCCKITAH